MLAPHSELYGKYGLTRGKFYHVSVAETTFPLTFLWGRYELGTLSNQHAGFEMQPFPNRVLKVRFSQLGKRH